jgi:hypothetical protein
VKGCNYWHASCIFVYSLDAFNPELNSGGETATIAAITLHPERNRAEKIITSAGGVGAIWSKPIPSTHTSNRKPINFTLETSTLALIGLKVSQRGWVFFACRRRRLQQADRRVGRREHTQIVEMHLPATGSDLANTYGRVRSALCTLMW